jgi:telomere length regulation protein
VTLGVFPSTPPTSGSQPSFFFATLPTIRARLRSEGQHVYSSFWCKIFGAIPSTFTKQAMFASLFSSLTTISPGLSPSPYQRSLVRREAMLLRHLFGSLDQELWECVEAVTLGRVWSEGHGRIIACWAAGVDTSEVDQAGKAGIVLIR